jgi:SUMO ligase MMS21 Smc5/6 complex component
MLVVLVFAAIINGKVTHIYDDDGISEFRSYRACVLYAIRRKIELEAVMRDNGLNERIEWRCAY